LPAAADWAPRGAASVAAMYLAARPDALMDVRVHGFELIRTLREGNAVASYEAREGARRVFVKEARSSGAQERLRREHRMLLALRDTAPGIAPEPRDYLREPDCEVLVCEFIDGMPLDRWVAAHSPMLRGARRGEDYAAYYAACARVLADLDRALLFMDCAGHRLGALEPAGVVVTREDGARIVDFPAPDDGTDLRGADGIALALLLPSHAQLGGSVRNLRLLYRDLAERAPVPAWLTRRTSRSRAAGDADGWLPTPEELDARPRETMERFAQEVRRGLLAAVERGAYTKTPTLAHGTAGIVHALGQSAPEELVEQLCDEAMARRAELAPGLHFGAAGAACVLAQHDRLAEAAELLEIAERHPVTLVCSTLGEGAAGVGLAQLAMHRHTGDEWWRERAAEAGDAILATPDLAPTLGAEDAVGLLDGRCGLALFLHRLARITDDPRYLEAGRRLLHLELKRAAEDAPSSLYAGAAGVLTVATRYLEATGDERLALALPRLAADVRQTCASSPGLYAGLAGLAFALAEHADWAGDDRHRRAALRVATGLPKYATPHAEGSGFRDESGRRESAELWGGAAGVLVALDRALGARRTSALTGGRIAAHDAGA
jgi:hypothetical protein